MNKVFLSLLLLSSILLFSCNDAKEREKKGTRDCNRIKLLILADADSNCSDPNYRTSFHYTDYNSCFSTLSMLDLIMCTPL